MKQRSDSTALFALILTNRILIAHISWYLTRTTYLLNFLEATLDAKDAHYEEPLPILEANIHLLSETRNPDPRGG